MDGISRAVRFGAATVVLAATVAAGATVASAAVVDDEVALRAAVADPAATTVVVLADIDLTDCEAGQVVRPLDAPPITISGSATIRQMCPGHRVLGSALPAGQPGPGATGALTMEGLTITGGDLDSGGSSFGGGGIFWAGPVTLRDVRLLGNRALGSTYYGTGGGLAAMGDATLVRTTVANNVAGAAEGGGFGGFGGGVVAWADLTLVESAITGNVAASSSFPGNGGGIWVLGESAVVERSTVADNRAEAGGAIPAHGGGISARYLLSLRASTVVGNVAEGSDSRGGGLEAGHLVVADSTVVANAAGFAANVLQWPDQGTDRRDPVVGSVIATPLGGGRNCEAVNTSGTTATEGHNFSDDDSCGLTAPTDRQSAGDPELGSLADNGGPTWTRSPLADSPLLDAIPIASCEDGAAAGLTTDQRGVGRPQGPGCDIGAVEAAVAPPTPTTSSPTSTGPTPPTSAPPVPPAPPAAPVVADPRLAG
jgi:hypothetical protein